jgi:hypothetical protein
MAKWSLMKVTLVLAVFVAFEGEEQEEKFLFLACLNAEIRCTLRL